MPTNTRAAPTLFCSTPRPLLTRLLPGGNGVPFDWDALKGIKPPFALSGGLTPDTVGEAIRLTGASLVDVSSGVERAPGEKDAELVRRFIRAAKGAAPQSRAKAS